MEGSQLKQDTLLASDRAEWFGAKSRVLDSDQANVQCLILGPSDKQNGHSRSALRRLIAATVGKNKSYVVT